MRAPPYDTHPNQGNQYAQAQTLPEPSELAARIEESRTSAKLLNQLLLSTPLPEVQSNDLIKEFADRCQSASTSIQAFIRSQNPPPDEDTMLTLIETNEQLSMAMSKHQRAVLQARKAGGVATPSPPVPSKNGGSAFAPPPGPPPKPSRSTEPAEASSSTGGFAPPPGPPPGPQYTQNQSYKDDFSIGNPFADSNATNPFSQHPPDGSSHDNGLPSPPPPSNLQAPLQPQVTGAGASGGSDEPSRYQTPPTQYTTTPSYVRRQDSAMQNVTMHGASPPDSATR